MVGAQQEPQAEQSNGNTQNLAHSDALQENKSEMGIRLPKHLNKEPHDGIAQEKHPANATGRPGFSRKKPNQEK